MLKPISLYFVCVCVCLCLFLPKKKKNYYGGVGFRITRGQLFSYRYIHPILGSLYYTVPNRGVHLTAQIVKTTPKPSAKWYNPTTPQVTVHHIGPHCMVQCNLRFYNNKIAQTALLVPSLYINIYIYIYFLMLNILLIV